MNEESVRLVYCSKCQFSDKHDTETTTGKPFCTNWKQYLDCGCFYGSPRTAIKYTEQLTGSKNNKE